MWIFFKPLTLGLWLTIATFFILTGTIVRLIEHHDNVNFQGSCFHQIGTLLCFGFSVLLSLPIGRSCSIICGYCLASLVYDNPAFRGPRYKGLETAEDYVNALKSGTISFIVNEVPYIKLLVAKYPSEL